MQRRRRAGSRFAALSLLSLFLFELPAACVLDTHGTIVVGGPCEPGQKSACYTGPAETRDVGRCTSGTAVCRIDERYGECIGEVLPAKEDCDTVEDEDCDGEGREDEECACAVGSTLPCDTGQLGVCAAGKRYCAEDGFSYGPCLPDEKVSQEDCVTELDEDCDGGSPPCTGAADAAGGVGNGLSDVAFAVGTSGLVSAAVGVADGIVDKDAVSLGAFYIERRDSKVDLSWSKKYQPVGGLAAGRSVLVTPGGGIVAAGEYSGVMDLGGGKVLTGTAGTRDVFVASFDTTGNVNWAESFGDVGDQAARALAWGKNGSIYVAGEATGTIDFGGSPLTAAGGDVFVALLDGTGKHAWSRLYGDGLDQRAFAAASTAEGDVVLAGEFDGSLDFGVANLSSLGDDAFVARLSPFDGSGKWAVKFGDDASLQRARAVAVGPSGEIAIAGDFAGSMTIGGATLVSTSQRNVFVAVLEADGTPRWAKQFGDAAGNDRIGAGVAFDPLGHVLVTGSFDGQIDFGAGLVAANGQADVFVAKLAGPTGQVVWAKRAGGPEASRGWAVSSMPSARVVAVGGFYGTIDFGSPTMPLTSAGLEDLFLVRMAP